MFQQGQLWSLSTFFPSPRSLKMTEVLPENSSKIVTQLEFVQTTIIPIISSTDKQQKLRHLPGEGGLKMLRNSSSKSYKVEQSSCALRNAVAYFQTLIASLSARKRSFLSAFEKKIKNVSRVDSFIII